MTTLCESGLQNSPLKAEKSFSGMKGATSSTGIQTIQGRETGSNQGDLTFINPSKKHRRLAAIIACRNELK